MAWTDHVALKLQVASTGGHGPDVSKWAATSDPVKSRWTPAATNATGQPGRWESTLTIRDQTWTDWRTIPWVDVLCDAMSVHTAQGWSPYAWNASANSASFTLVDPEMDFSPAGPDLRNLGVGFDLPVRLIADWLDPNGGEVVVWAGLIREVVWSATPGGERRATIRATEVSEVYGRTDPEPEGAESRPAESLSTRTYRLHAISDMPNLFQGPQPYNSKGPVEVADTWNPSTVYASLVDWGGPTDMYAAAAALDHNVWSDMCHWFNGVGGMAVALNYHHAYVNVTASPGTPRVAMVTPFVVRYPITPILEVGDSCSDPAGYPFTSSISTGLRVRLSPTALRITSSQADIANDVKVALAGTTGAQAHRINQGSVNAYGRHTYGRNDLRMAPTGGPTNVQLADKIAWRVTLRTSMARDHLEAMDFPVTTRRDLQGLVGWHWPSTTAVPQVFQPGRVGELHWSDPDIADSAMLITKVEHSISPTAWTCRVSAELFDWDHYYGKDNP